MTYFVLPLTIDTIDDIIIVFSLFFSTSKTKNVNINLFNQLRSHSEVLLVRDTERG